MGTPQLVGVNCVTSEAKLVGGTIAPLWVKQGGSNGHQTSGQEVLRCESVTDR
jgi:hypothetical protein